MVHFFIKFRLILSSFTLSVYFCLNELYKACLSKYTIINILSYFFFLLFVVVYVGLLPLWHWLNLSFSCALIFFRLNHWALRFFLKACSVMQIFCKVNIFFQFYYLSKFLSEFNSVDVIFSLLIIKEVANACLQNMFLISKPFFRYCIFLFKFLFYIKLQLLDIRLYEVISRFILNFKEKLISKAYLYKLGFFYYFFKLVKFIIRKGVSFLKFLAWLKLEVIAISLHYYELILKAHIKSRKYFLLFFFLTNLIEYVAYFAGKLWLFLRIRG
jgi:hypothetical protein